MGDYEKLANIKNQLTEAINESKTIGGLVFRISEIKEIYDYLENNYFPTKNNNAKEEN